MEFLSLPNELILLIGEELGIAQLSSLMRTCHRFSELLTPRFHTLRVALAQKGKGHQSAIFCAAQRSDEPLARMILTYGNSTLTEIQDALHAAVFFGGHGIVRMLLEHGANPNIAHEQPGRALNLASKVGNHEVVKVLIEHGVDNSIPNAVGRTALHFAAYNAHHLVAQALLETDIDLEARCHAGKTPLYMACDWGGLRPYWNDSVTSNDLIVGLLLARGADPNAECPVGRTPLLVASYWGFENIVKLLLDNGADINHQDIGGNTALHLAAKRGHLEILKILLGRGARRDLRNNHGKIPSRTARDFRHSDMFKQACIVNRVAEEP